MINFKVFDNTNNIKYNNNSLTRAVPQKSTDISERAEQAQPYVSSMQLVNALSSKVSFSGAGKMSGNAMVYAPSEATARQLRKCAEPAEFYLKSVFQNYLEPLVPEKKGMRKEDTVSFETRLKSPSSIREKVASKVIKLHDAEIKSFTEQVTDSLAEQFGFKDNVTRDLALLHIGSVVGLDFNYDARLSPYAVIPSTVKKAVEVAKERSLFDFDRYSEKQQEFAIDEIINDISESDAAKAALERTSYNPQNVSGVKYYAYDLVGGKIVLNDDVENTAKAITEGLKAAVKDNKLKIKSIENNIPAAAMLPEGKRVEDYAYIPESKLKELANLSGAELITNESKSGYISVHINVDLSSDILKRYGGKFNGYGGEIQIIGKDVASLKKVEDLCYKLKDDKSPQHPAYKRFREYFFKYCNNKKIRDKFNEYTYNLYLNQRTSKSSRRDTVFPTITEMGYSYEDIPKELDYNLLKEIKEDCDRLKSKMEEEKEAKRLEKKAGQEPGLSEVQLKGDIDAAMAVISYSLKK